MLDEILLSMDKIEKVLSTFKISMILGVIVNFIIIWFLFKLTDIFVNKLQGRFQSNENAQSFNHLFPIIEKTIKFLIVFFIVASFLQSHGYSLTSLIAGFGITGLAVGFAAQQTIAAMFGTLGIITDKVFKIGDYIKLNNIEGTVEGINLRSTKIRSLDNFLVTVPNNTVADGVIENLTRAHKRRIDVSFGVTYDTSNEKLQRAIDIIKEIAKERNDLYKDYIANIDELDSSSINIRFIAYAKTKAYNEYVRIKGEILMETIKRYRAEGIDFAFPSTTVYMAKEQ